MQPLTGFRDLLPASCAERNYIFAKWREVAGRYGFVEFDGPVLEELDLYKKKSGDEIVRQLYEFVDKGERAVALRPEQMLPQERAAAAADVHGRSIYHHARRHEKTGRSRSVHQLHDDRRFQRRG